MANDLETCLAESGTLAFRVAFRLLRSREDAEDVSQEAVVRAIQRFESLRDRSRFRPWLVRMAWRLAIDRRRSDWRRAGRETHLVSTGSVEADVERELIARERAAHVRAAVEQLPVKLRTPLVLSNMEGRSLDEVAELLQLPAGTVKSRAFQARKRVRQNLVKAGVALGLFGTTVLALQRLSFIDRPNIPVVAPVARASSPRLPDAIVQPQVQIASHAPALTARVGDWSPAGRISANVKVPTVEVPVIVIPLVRIPAVQVRTVETTTVTVPSGLMEKQR